MYIKAAPAKCYLPIPENWCKFRFYYVILVASSKREDFGLGWGQNDKSSIVALQYCPFCTYVMTSHTMKDAVCNATLSSLL